MSTPTHPPRRRGLIPALSPATLLAAALVAVAGATPAEGADPRCSRIEPRGGQRGTSVELTFRGDRLGDVEEILFYSPEHFAVKELAAADAKTVRAVVEIAPGCPLGEHQMRLRTRGGISDLRTFWVGPFPTVAEAEPNTDFDDAQEVGLNVTVDGVVQSEDVDYYAVKASKGQRISAEVEGIRLGLTLFDPYVAILNTKRFELDASDDTALLLQDPVASVVAPEDGTYVIEVRESSYGGSGDCRYRLHLGTFPRPVAAYPPGGPAGQPLEVTLIGDRSGSLSRTVDLPEKAPPGGFGVRAEADGIPSPAPVPLRVSPFANVLEAEPNDARGQATPTDLPLPLAFNGVIGADDDVDWFRFGAKKGQRFTVRVYARGIRSPLDSVLRLYGADGKQITSNDDTGGPDSKVDFNCPADGDYFLRINDHLKKGGPGYVYRIETEPVAPALSVSIPQFQRNDPQARQVIPVPRGNRYATLVRVARSNFRGDVAFEAPGLPAGVSLQAEVLPNGIDTFPVVFEAAPDAAVAGALAPFAARSTGGENPVSGGIGQTIDLVRGNPNNTVYYRTRAERLPVAVVEEAPFTIDLVEPAVPIVRNGTLDLEVVAVRAEGFDGPITVRMLWNPPGIGSPNTVTIEKGQTTVRYRLNADGGAQVREWKIAVLGEADAGKGPVLASSRLTRLSVEEPFVAMQIEMAAIVRGEASEVLCKLEQRRPFEGEAVVRLYGLPAKVTTVEKAITSDLKEITFPVKTDKSSPVGKHQQLFCSIEVPANGTVIPHSVGAGGILRIDNPPPPKKDPPKPAPKPAPKAEVAAKETPKPKPEPAKRLSRLEQLRLQAKERAAGGGR